MVARPKPHTQARSSQTLIEECHRAEDTYFFFFMAFMAFFMGAAFLAFMAFCEVSETET